MELIYFSVGLLLLILNIFILVKFFQMAKDIHTINPSTYELYDRIDLMLALGQTEEAKKLVLQLAIKHQSNLDEKMKSKTKIIEKIKTEMSDLLSKVGINQ